jgi:PAS domain S-box-containing protein
MFAMPLKISLVAQFFLLLLPVTAMSHNAPLAAAGTEDWWQSHLLQVTLVIGFLLLSTLLLAIRSFALSRRYRHKSYLLEQSLDVATELVFDLEQQRQQADLYLEISEAMVIGLDPTGKIASANQRACSLLGYTHDELIGNDWFATCLPEESREHVKQIFADVLVHGSLHYPVIDGEIITRTGEIKNIQWHNIVRHDESGKATGTLSSGINITPRINALRELSESRERFELLSNQFESLLHGITDPLLIVNRDLNLLWANDAAKENWFFSGSVLQGQLCRKIDMCQQLCEEECLFRECFNSNTELRRNYYHSSGRSMMIRVFPASSDNGNPQSVIVFAQDITEVLKTRTEIARASQLASVGELAANVAHEINNPLHGIINYADILKMKPHDPEFTRDLVTRIATEGERISLIVRNLLEYTRRKNDNPGPAALSMIFESADMLLGHKLRMKNIVIELDLPVNLPLIRARSNQLQQVFINLLNNAHDALLEKEFAETDQKQIRISAKTLGDMVEICFEDNGPGIPDLVLNRVFESFFTTKPVGSGTGLGLSISKSIINEHGGEMRVESAEGQWARVYFTIPVFTLPEQTTAD